MKVNTLTLSDQGWPEILQQLAQPPKLLYWASNDLFELLSMPALAVVGSRKASAYGREVTSRLAGDLARAGVVIVSGLALGVDAIAHQAALDAGGRTIAILPAGVEDVYPRQHYRLAMQILEQGGALISEYPKGTPAAKHNFIARNRLIAAFAQGTLVTEAAEKSGSLHTVDFTAQLGKEVFAVPGNITSVTSGGTNNLLKDGAHFVTHAQDILDALKIDPQPQQPSIVSEDNVLLALLKSGIRDKQTLLLQSKLSVSEFNRQITMLELAGSISQSPGSTSISFIA